MLKVIRRYGPRSLLNLVNNLADHPCSRQDARDESRWVLNDDHSRTKKSHGGDCFRHSALCPTRHSADLAVSLERLSRSWEDGKVDSGLKPLPGTDARKSRLTSVFQESGVMFAQGRMNAR